MQGGEVWGGTVCRVVRCGEEKCCVQGGEVWGGEVLCAGW